jgi:hypothetical protein
MIAIYAKDPVPLTPSVSLIFHQPNLVISGPFTWDTILNLSKDSTSDIIHGLYLRYEQDAQDDRIRRFNSGDIICLQKDVGRELRMVLKTWVKLWEKGVGELFDDVDENWGIDSVHLQWISRIAQGLCDELFFLGTAQRRHTYVLSIRDCRTEIPNLLH